MKSIIEKYNQHGAKGKTEKVLLEKTKLRITFPLFKDMIRKFAKTQVL